MATLTYQYAQATAVIGPLSPKPVPGALDLCAGHVHTVTAPRGWEMVRLQTSFEEAPPSESDLMALADAIRETAKHPVAPPERASREIRRPVELPEPRPRRAKLSLVPDERPAEQAGEHAAERAGQQVDDEPPARQTQGGRTGADRTRAGGTSKASKGDVDLTDADHLLDD